MSRGWFDGGVSVCIRFDSIWLCVTGLHSPHEGMAGSSGQSMSGLAYYQPEHPASTGVVKYPENGHDTLSDFVTFVCQEAENTQQLPQVASGSVETATVSSLLS